MSEASSSQIAPFITFILALTPTELTTFYCERCHVRLKGPSESWPKDSFQEKSGWCSQCQRVKNVSNPHVNQFLNQHGILLDSDNTDQPVDAKLIRDWFIPFGYGRFRKNDEAHKIKMVVTWINYGRQRAKDARHSRSLDQRAKSLLTEFFYKRYEVSSFNANPMSEPVNTSNELTKLLSPGQGELLGTEVSVASKKYQFTSVDLSTLSSLDRFVASIKNLWKGKKDETGN